MAIRLNVKLFSFYRRDEGLTSRNGPQSTTILTKLRSVTKIQLIIDGLKKDFPVFLSFTAISQVIERYWYCVRVFVVKATSD